MKQIIQGQLVRITANFKTLTGSLLDPTVVQFKRYRVADADLVTYTYGSGTLLRTSTGIYYVDLDTTALSGQYNWQFLATGTGQNMQQGSFYVQQSNTSTPAA